VIAARMQLPPTPLAAVSPDTAGLTYRSATATGTYDPERTILLAGRVYESAPGVYLMTPLRLSTAGAVLVNRGFLPSPDAATVDIRPYLDVGAAQVRGILMPMPVGEVPPTSGFRRTWFHIDPAALARQLPYALEPLVLQVTPIPGQPLALPRPLPPPALDEGPHFSYAIQWFSFAAIGIIGWLALLLRGQGAERGPGEARESGPPPR
ncbi:MAG TPA: SURF1 family protein, partial [Longimicrobiales bacterium]